MRKAAIATATALVAVDAVLVGLALGHVGTATETATGRGQPAGSPSRPGAGPSDTSDDADDGPSPDATERPSNPASVANRWAIADRTLLDTGAGEAVIRARTGRCDDGGGSVEMSLDDGKSWTTTSAEGVAVVLSVHSTDADVAHVVGADTDCASFTGYDTDNGGGDWSQEDADGEWFRLAATGSQVHGPDGKTNVPCAEGDSVIDLKPVADGENGEAGEDGEDGEDGDDLAEADGVALCGAGTVYRSDDGADWDRLGSQPGAAAVDFSDNETGMLVVPEAPNCAGIGIYGYAAGNNDRWQRRGCVATDSAEPPDIAVDDDNDEAYLAQGMTVWFTDDGGSTWSEQGSQ